MGASLSCNYTYIKHVFGLCCTLSCCGGMLCKFHILNVTDVSVKYLVSGMIVSHCCRRFLSVANFTPCLLERECSAYTLMFQIGCASTTSSLCQEFCMHDCVIMCDLLRLQCKHTPEINPRSSATAVVALGPLQRE